MGCAWLLKEVMQRCGFRVTNYEHLCRGNWGKKGCGYEYCAACDDMSEEKEAIVRRVLDMWNSL